MYKPRSYYGSLNSVRFVSRQCCFCAEPEEDSSGDSLHRRILTHLESTAKIAPVLDQWLHEGKTLEMKELHIIINGFRRNLRYDHALQVSQWMSGRTDYKILKGDVAVRFDLISKVHGPEKAEKYLCNIDDLNIRMQAYANIIHSCAQEKSVEKAEILMNKLRYSELGRSTVVYNAMLHLYRRIHNREKIDALIQEMEERDIKHDKITFSLLTGIYTDASDNEKLERVIQKMEHGTEVRFDWELYSIAANTFIKTGIYEKAIYLLKKSENFVTPKNLSHAFDILLRQYAMIDKKEEVLRIWKLKKEKDTLDNKSYINMMNSLVKLDDLKGAEIIFDEWESSKLSFDFLIPNILVGAYCNKGLVEKAEAFIERAIRRGGKPIPDTFYYLATGYIVNKEMEKALEAMEIAVSNSKTRWRPSIAKVEACLVHLKDKGDVEEAKRFLRLLFDKKAISADLFSRLNVDLKKGGDLQMYNL